MKRFYFATMMLFCLFLVGCKPEPEIPTVVTEEFSEIVLKSVEKIFEENHKNIRRILKMAQTKTRARKFDAEYNLADIGKYSLNANFYLLLTQLMGMFRYTGALEDIKIDIIEKPLLSWGYNAAGINPEDNELYIGSIAWQAIDAYGLPKPGAKATLVTRGGVEFNGVIDESIVVGYNNKAAGAYYGYVCRIFYGDRQVVKMCSRKE